MRVQWLALNIELIGIGEKPDACESSPHKCKQPQEPKLQGLLLVVVASLRLRTV